FGDTVKFEIRPRNFQRSVFAGQHRIININFYGVTELEVRTFIIKRKYQTCNRTTEGILYDKFIFSKITIVNIGNDNSCQLKSSFEIFFLQRHIVSYM